METKTELVLNWLIERRMYVLIFIAVLLGGSFAAGYVYQNNQTKEKEASILFDDAWQKSYLILDEMNKQPNQTFTPSATNFTQVTNFYSEVLIDLETLVYEYQDTVGGARSVLLVQMLLPLTNLNNLMADSTSLASLQSEDYIDAIKDKHPNYWGAVIALNEAVRAEQIFDFANALTLYQEALALDKKGYISDYIIIAIARNQEALDNLEQALEFYQRIEKEYPNSVWLSFAMGKSYIISSKLEAKSSTTDKVEEVVVEEEVVTQ